jgi:ABC-type bacteriocin/lantibiotic exporter with double-glycine peptidase domain
MVAVAAGAATSAAGDPGPARGDAALAGLLLLCRELDAPIDEAEARAAAPLPEEAVGIGALARLAQRLGFSARALRVGRGRLARLPTPFLLIGREPGRAWLARARAGGRLVLVDPLTGTTRAETPAAVARLARQALLLARPAEEERRTLGRTLLGRIGRPLWEIGLASVVINLLALATPVFLMTVYNKVIGHGALETLDVLALGMVSLLGFELLLRGLRGFIASHTGARLDALIGSEVVHHILRLPYRAFETMPAGQLTERLRQLDQLRQFLTGGLPLLAVDLAFVGLFMAALFALSPAMGWITLAAVPLFLLLSLVAQRRQAALDRQGFRAAAAKTSCLAEAVSQALTIKALGLEPEIERRFERRLIASSIAGYRAGNLASLVGGTGQAVQHLTALMLVYVGARMVVAGDLSVGALVACNILAARALAPIRQLFGAWQQLQQAREAWRRIDALLGEAPERPGRAMVGEFRGAIRLERVSFRYALDKAPALHELSLDIAPGTTTAIVGAPGSGKSTLVRLLLGLERSGDGRVLLDGVEVTRLAPAELRTRIGVVPQEIHLFEGTIAENIGLGAAERSLGRIVAASRFVGLDPIVRRLPDGYETMLGERGVGLSAGQRQLVAIARALVRNPRLLVLDEATSALDQASEAQLLDNLRRAGGGRTIVLVTHRLALLARCDVAVLLQHGRLVRCGPAAEIASMLGAAAARPELRAAG